MNEENIFQILKALTTKLHEILKSSNAMLYWRGVNYMKNTMKVNNWQGKEVAFAVDKWLIKKKYQRSNLIIAVA
jgi:hypothetical protein